MAAWVSINPCGRRLLRELFSFRSHSSSYELVVMGVLCMTMLEVWERPRSSGMKRFFRAAWGEAWQLAALFCELDVLPFPPPALEEGCGPGRWILFHCSCSRLIRKISSVGASDFLCWQDWSRWGCGQKWYIQFSPCLAPPTSSIWGWVGPSIAVCVSKRFLPGWLLCVGSVLQWPVWRTSPFPHPLWF
jgi:hypothetical protein